MGQQGGAQAGGAALMIGGQLLGSFIGGPIGGAIGGLAGGIIGSLLFNRSAKPLISDAQLATSSYGHFIPILYGKGRFAATVIWQSDINTKSHGLFGKGMGQTTYSYYQSAAFAFVQGPAKLLKVWLDQKLFYDATSTNPVEITKYPFPARIYMGDEVQLPDFLIEDWVAAYVIPGSSCPAYRGLAYIVFDHVDIGHYGNRLPNVTASWATDYEEKILGTQMIPWVNDVSDVYGEAMGFGSSISTDWISGRIYTQSNDGAVRVFDLHSGQCVAAKAFDDLWPAGEKPPWLTGVVYPVGPSAVCQGSFMYFVLSAEGWGFSASILTIDPNTLLVVNTVPVPLCPYPQGIFKLVPFQIVSVGFDPADMLVVCQDIWGASIINPKTGASSATIPLHWGGIDVTTAVVIGKQDTVVGTVEVWFLNSNFLFDGTASLYIYKTIVSGSDPSAAADLTTLEGILYPSDFGITIVGEGAMQDLNGVYDASDDTLIISNGAVGLYTPGTSSGRAIKWKAGTTDATIDPTWTVEYIMPQAAVWSNAVTSYYQTDGGIIGNAMGPYWVTQAATGSIEGPYTAPDLPFGVFYIHGYSSSLNALVVTGWGTGIWVVYLQRVAAADVPVANILSDLCLRAGLDAGSFDVSGVTETTIGYAIMEEKSYGQCISDLCQTYQIDMVESDYMLKFVQRGNAPIVTIPQADLGSLDADPSHFWEAKRALEQEMPLQLNVKYSDPDLDFQPGASYTKRTALPVPTVFSRRVKTIDLPVVATNVQARHVAESWLYTMWAERDTYKTALGQKYLWLDPTDNVTVAFDDGDQLTVRIQTVDMGDDYSLKLDLASEDATTYVASTSPGALISFPPQTITQTAFIDLLQFNTPLLQDSDDLGGAQMRTYFAGGPTSALAPSAAATLYHSIDGSAWPPYADMSDFADWGTATGPLGSTVAAFSTDYVNTVSFILSPGSTPPTSCNYVDMMNGENAALVGSEIIQFMLVTSNSDGSFTLSNLLRGRRGTEWAVETHVTGERVIFLAIGQIQPGKLPLSQRGSTTLWKLVPSGRFLDSTPADSFAYRGYDLMPYAPVNAERSFTGSDLMLTWIRRTRLGGLLVDGTDTAPLGEESEGYEVYLLDTPDLAGFSPTDPATYRRAFLALTSPTLTYTAAQMVTDGFDITTDTIHAVIYQLSAVVGRGFPGFHVLPPPGGSLTVGLEDGSGIWSSWVWG